MGPLKTITFYLLLLCSFHGLPQDEEAIAWDASRKLSWTDFRGQPFKTAWAAATTASGISYEYTAQERDDGYEIDFKVGAYFYPDKSWYQPHLCDEVILSHEQLHFDISELYARKMRDILSRTRFGKNVKAEVAGIYKQILEELNELQTHYDHETNFSRNREKQEAWNKKIARALEENL